MAPPIRQMIMASMINCIRIDWLVAPSAFLVPISLVRSVMDTSIMFITPMPPTSREMPAITEMATCTVDSMEEKALTMDSILKAIT